MKLRDYQIEAVTAGLRYFRDEKSKGGAIMILPTGSGKSLVIAEIAHQLAEPLLVFQPSKEILEQNFKKYVAYGNPASIYSASFNSKRISQVTFATIGSVIRKPEVFSRFKHIIIDECHGVNPKGGMYKDFLNVVGGKVLGLTATPYRLVTDGFGGSILKFITRTRPRVFNRVVHVTQNGSLFERGYLATLDYQTVEGFDSGELRLNTTGADYTDASVKAYYKRVNFKARVAEVVKRCMQFGQKSILVFTRFVEEAEYVSEAIGAEAAVVSAQTRPRDRAQVIQAFRSGRTRVVTNVGVLTTGFDFPELETVIIARPTMSLALYYQMIGRGIRIHPDKGSTVVVDLCDNFSKFGRVEDLKLVEPKRNLWHIESRGRQLTNIYFGNTPLHGRGGERKEWPE